MTYYLQYVFTLHYEDRPTTYFYPPLRWHTYNMYLPSIMRTYLQHVLTLNCGDCNVCFCPCIIRTARSIKSDGAIGSVLDYKVLWEGGARTGPSLPLWMPDPVIHMPTRCDLVGSREEPRQELNRSSLMEVMTVINLKLRWVDGGEGRTKGERDRGRDRGRYRRRRSWQRVKKMQSSKKSHVGKKNS